MSRPATPLTETGRTILRDLEARISDLDQDEAHTYDRGRLSGLKAAYALVYAHIGDAEVDAVLLTRPGLTREQASDLLGSMGGAPIASAA